MARVGNVLWDGVDIYAAQIVIRGCGGVVARGGVEVMASGHRSHGFETAASAAEGVTNVGDLLLGETQGIGIGAVGTEVAGEAGVVATFIVSSAATSTASMASEIRKVHGVAG